MFVYTEFKVVKPSETPMWIFRRFVNTGKTLEGRVNVFQDGAVGIHQIKHPHYSQWFDVEKELIEYTLPNVNFNK